MGIIQKEFFALYESKGKAVLPPSKPFRHYVKWLVEQDKPTALKYWKTQLQDFDTPTPLPGTKKFIRDCFK